jgi:hypothetical protein
MKHITLLLIASLLIIKAHTQVIDSVKVIIERTKVQLKITDATSKYYKNNYKGSLNLFKEALALDKNNPKASFGIAQCYYSMKNYEKAKQYSEDAFRIDPKVDDDIKYLMGNIYFRLSEFDKAEKYFSAFASTIKPEKSKDYRVDLLVKQLSYARSEVNNPIKVEIKNMGDNINTKNPEFAPCISQDGKYMIFTSRRSNTMGGGIDIHYDFLYFSDIYFSKWDEDLDTWGTPSNNIGKVNTEFHDGGLGFTSDNSLLVYRNIFNVTRSGDIYVAKKADSDTWASPKPIAYKNKKISKKINSTYFESSASITADEKYIYFVSERPGGSGQADIYYVEKIGKTYTEPVNAGTTINASGDEKCVFIHPTGKILFFTSNSRENSIGSYDIYYCTGGHGNWSEPINMGYPINTVLEEKTISVSSDGKTAYVGAYYDIENHGDADIFKIDISSLKLDEFLGKD